MADSVTTLAQQLRPFWLRDLGASAASQSGGGSGMIAHSLNGGYHTGTLDEAQAPWAVTDTEFLTHTGNANAHHATATAGNGITVSGQQITLASTTAGNGLTYTTGVLAVGVSGLGLGVGADAVTLTSSSDVGTTPAAAILASTSGGGLTLKTLDIGTVDETTGVGNLNFTGHAVLDVPRSAHLFLDSDNNSTAAAFIIGANGTNTTDATELFRFTEAGRLGIGNAAPSYELDVTGTARFTTSVRAPLLDTVSGNMSITPAGDLVLDPGGSDVLPGGSVEDDLGDYNRKWRTLFAAELYVETLVAQDVLSTIGGRIEVTPTTTLIADLASGATTMDVKHNNLRQNEYAYMMAAPGGVAQIEAIKVISTATVITGGYRYTITRNLDGTGGNSWVAGDAVASLGKSVGEGHISLTSTSTIYNHLGPTIAIYSRNATTAWNSITPTVALGDLESFVGYGTPTMGLAIGNDLTKEPTTGFKGLTADATNGVRLFSTALSTYNGATQTFNLSPTGDDMWIGPSSSDKRLTWDGTTLAFTQGYIGTAAAGWSITSNTISAAYMRLVSSTSTASRIEVGDYAGSSANVAGIRGGDGGDTTVTIWSGATLANRDTAPFRVTLAGALTATSATITGDITANIGYIGGTSGWTIASGLLSSSNVKLYSGSTTNARLELGTGSDANTAGVRGGDGTTNAVAFWAGATHANRATAPFRAYLDGRVFATSATVSGDFSVNSSTFGNAGVQMQYNSGNPKFYVGDGSTSFLKFISGAGAGEGYPIASGLRIEGAAYVTGSVYAGTGNIRLSTNGQTLYLPDTTTPDIPLGTSAIRWRADTFANTWNKGTSYTGMIGYKNTASTPDVLDLTLTSVVGDNDDTTHDARIILQAGNYAGGTAGESPPYNSSVYSDTLLVITRERAGGAKTINAICDTFSASNNVYVTANMSAQSITDRTPYYDGDALAELRGVKGKTKLARGKLVKEIDHATIPAFARRRVEQWDTRQMEDERDIGAMISILVRAVQQLDARLDTMGA